MAQFRTKARAVELLGKGQIADLPTAISELWKNGYDAYGDKLEAALYMPNYLNNSDPVFVVSDDGKGMDKAEVANKWFVLGTDSKSRGVADEKGESTLNKEPRIKMGEKGIGRLAVAYLGPQMLMLTKAKRKPLEMVFFDWRILENYNLFLSDINIPIQSVSSVTELESVFKKLKQEFKLNFPIVKKGEIDPWRDQQALKQAITSECEQLTLPGFITEDWIEDLFQEPETSHSTRFIIFQPDEQLVQLRNFTKRDGSEDSNDEVTYAHTISTLTGLFNLFKNENPAHKTYFWIYEENDVGRHDLLTHRAFFVPDDFKDCDHLIDGSFNDQGIFSGNVRIYNRQVPHRFIPQRKSGNSTYGPFKIKMGYVNPLANESMIPEERKRMFEGKLDLYSGLFIYRDEFRVLPYGRVDNDFLEFEDRRSKGAGTYFFSKRRMFGYIEISREHNEKLRDKSSREGFINNQAYRDFRTDLIAFFKDLAKQYFATKADYDFKKEQQKELKEQSLAEKIEQERDKEARKKFAQELREKPAELNALRSQYENYVNSLNEKSASADVVYDQIQELIGKIEDCRAQIVKYKMALPARFKPTDLQVKKFHTYSENYISVVKEFDKVNDILQPVRDKLKVHELFREFEDKSDYYYHTLSSYYHNYDGELSEIFQNIKKEFVSEKEVFLDEYNEKAKAIVPARNNASEIASSLKILENIFQESQLRIRNRLEPYLNHLRRLSFDVNEDNLVGYYKAQFEEMKEEWAKTYELAQLGIAVEIIDHQFNTIYAQMAESIRSLSPYLRQGAAPERVFKNLSNAFEHLQDNYKLLQPIYRTTGRIPRDITGAELKDYIEEFFDTRLGENKIVFTITNAAREWTVKSYESIFKPVLINVVNNAIYWLQRADHKEIQLDAIEDKLLIMNSGARIEDYLMDDIFKLFYSGRPKGRGIGLYLAKQSLNSIGFQIEASNDPKYNRLNGACFIISPISNARK